MTGAPVPPALRPARSADAARVATLEAALFGDDAWSSAQVVEELSAPGRAMLVAHGVDPSVLTGYAVLAVTGDVADLLRIGVAPTARRSGVATALLSYLRCAASSAGAARLLLEVSAANSGAAAFYDAAGFVEIHRRPRYYRDGSDARVLQLDLAADHA